MFIKLLRLQVYLNNLLIKNTITPKIKYININNMSYFVLKNKIYKNYFLRILDVIKFSKFIKLYHDMARFNLYHQDNCYLLLFEKFIGKII